MSLPLTLDRQHYARTIAKFGFPLIVLLTVIIAVKSNESVLWFFGSCLIFLPLLLYFYFRPQPMDILFLLIAPSLIAIPGVIGIEAFPVTVMWLICMLLIWYVNGINLGWQLPNIPNPFIYPLVLYCSVVIISILFSQVDTGSLTNLIQCMAFIVVYWMFSHLFWGQNLHRLLNSIVLGVIISSVIFIIAFTGGTPQVAIAGLVHGIMRPEVLGFNANFWGFYPMIGIPLVATILLHRKVKRWQWISLVCSGLLMLGVSVINMSRSALLAIAVSTLFILTTNRKGRKILLYSGIITAILFIIFLPRIYPSIASLLRFQMGLSGREQLWPMAWSIIEDHPLLGLSPTTFVERFFFQAPFMEQGLQKLIGKPTAHNAFLNSGIDIGLIGPLLLLAIFGLFAFRSFKLWRRLKSTPDFLVLVAINGVMIAGFCRSMFETDFIVPHGYITKNLILIILLAFQDQLFARHPPDS